MMLQRLFAKAALLGSRNQPPSVRECARQGTLRGLRHLRFLRTTSSQGIKASNVRISGRRLHHQRVAGSSKLSKLHTAENMLQTLPHFADHARCSGLCSFAQLRDSFPRIFLRDCHRNFQQYPPQTSKNAALHVTLNYSMVIDGQKQ